VHRSTSERAVSEDTAHNPSNTASILDRLGDVWGNEVVDLTSAGLRLVLWADGAIRINVFANELAGDPWPCPIGSPARSRAVHSAKARFVGEHDAQAAATSGGSPPSSPHGGWKGLFLKLDLGRTGIGRVKRRCNVDGASKSSKNVDQRSSLRAFL
jgi:hypothetical protein